MSHAGARCEYLVGVRQAPRWAPRLPGGLALMAEVMCDYYDGLASPPQRGAWRVVMQLPQGAATRRYRVMSQAFAYVETQLRAFALGPKQWQRLVHPAERRGS